jgi:hypothetical protein
VDVISAYDEVVLLGVRLFPNVESHVAKQGSVAKINLGPNRRKIVRVTRDNDGFLYETYDIYERLEPYYFIIVTRRD